MNAKQLKRIVIVLANAGAVDVTVKGKRNTIVSATVDRSEIADLDYHLHDQWLCVRPIHDTFVASTQQRIVIDSIKAHQKRRRNK
ncbi:MAG: hypothetical protein GTO00_09185 [Deltaproteobacteria bacterium]|nr:hypothetical protein [Deltaproteobacteria bacterium]